MSDNESTQPLLSVVVPIYNVERYLTEALESLERQTIESVDYILVDDGSKDSSGAIAEEFAATRERFVFVRQDNRGLSGARNTGIRHARGKYLGFLDSDDIVEPETYRLLVESLESSGSDIATAQVDRFDTTKRYPSPMHRPISLSPGPGKTLHDNPDLLNDSTAWNKVWRRSFWDACGFEFPEGRLYEDTPIAIPSYARAKGIDVVPAARFLWRDRESGDSITQNRASSSKHFIDRLDAILVALRALEEHSAPELYRHYALRAAVHDLQLFVRLFDELDDGYRNDLQKGVKAFFDEVGFELLSDLTVIPRMSYLLLAQGELDELDHLMKMSKTGAINTVPVTVESGRAYLEYEPNSANATFERADLDITSSLALKTGVDDMRVEDGRLVVTGWSYVSRISGDRAGGETDLWFESKDRKVTGTIRRREAPRAQTAAAPLITGAEQTGFVAEFDLSAFRDGQGWAGGDWTLKATSSLMGIDVSGAIRNPRVGLPQRPIITRRGKGYQFRVNWGTDDQLHLRVRRDRLTLTRSEQRDGRLKLEFDAAVAPHRRILLRLRGENGADITVPVRRRLPNLSRAEVAIPVDRFGTGHGPDGTRFRAEAYVSGVQRGQAVSVADDWTFTPDYGDGLEAHCRRTMTGDLNVLVREPQPYFESARWSDDGTLEIELSSANASQIESVKFSSLSKVEEHECDIRIERERIVGTIAPSGLLEFGRVVPMTTGHWELRATQGGRDLPVTVRRNPESLPAAAEIGGRMHTFKDRHWHRFTLEIENSLTMDESGAGNQHRLQTVEYPAMKTGLRPAVLFEAYNGRQFNDSPYEILLELQRRDLDLDYHVVSSDHQIEVPEGASVVAKNSRDYYRLMATCKYIVNNTHLPPWFEKVPGQVVVQTWHGVGLKKIGLDIEKVHFKTVSYKDYILDESSQWDYLIGANALCYDNLKNAFGYQGETLRVGMPRNDRFFVDDLEERRRRIREAIGAPEDRKLLLYAPTWRDNEFYGGGRYKLTLPLDLEELSDAIGEEYTVLLRTHPNVVDQLDLHQRRFAVDVCSYPDMQDLLLVADVLVTDYSTSMLDFANTGRPMVFFAYDFDDYRDFLRGFYFDFESIAPGPIVKTAPELIDAVQRLDSIAEEYRDRYAEWRREACSWDDGKASQRVVDTVFRDELGG